MIGESVRVSIDRTPALEGAVITFSCPKSLDLTGPNTSTCMANGQWKEDLQNVDCKGV